MNDQSEGRALQRVGVQAGGQVAAIVPQTLDEAWRMSQYFAESGLTPKGIDTPAKVMFVIAGGAEVGFGPFQSLQAFALINGKLTMWGDAIPALLWSKGFKIKEWYENEAEDFPDNMTAFCTITRPDGEEITRKFSVGDAKRGKLWGKRGRDGQDTPWITFPQRMLQMRGRGWSARDGASDVLKGIAIREEVEDYDVIDGVVTSSAPVLQAPDTQRRRKAKPTPESGPPAGEDTQAATSGAAEGEGASTGAPDDTRGEEDQTAHAAEEVNEGCASPGEVYYHVDFPALDDNTRVAFMDGSRCEPPRMGEEVPLTYAEHSPEPVEDAEFEDRPTETGGAQDAEREPDTSETATPASDAGAPQEEGSGPSPPADDGEFEEEHPDETAYVDVVEKAENDWPTVRSALGVLQKTDFWQALTTESQNAMRRATWITLVERGAKGLPDHGADISAFRLWTEAQDDPDAIKGTLAMLEREPCMADGGAPPAAQTAVRQAAASRIALLRGA